MKAQIRPIFAAGGILATGCSGGTDGGTDFFDTKTVSQSFSYSGQALTVDAGTSDLVLVS